MKITVVTAVLNDRAGIAACIESVLMQTGAEVEHIVVDGGSTDGTAEIVARYRDRLALVIAEQDDGVYDAMNKGLRAATGEAVGFLNADDRYVRPDALARAAEAFARTGCGCCYGDVVFTRRRDPDAVVRVWRSRPFEPGLFARGWMPPHTAFFARRRVLEAAGGFDTSFRIAADYDLMLRILEKAAVPAVHMPGTLVAMREGGMSTAGPLRILRANIECVRSLRNNGLPASPLSILRKPLGKLRQLRAR